MDLMNMSNEMESLLVEGQNWKKTERSLLEADRAYQ